MGRLAATWILGLVFFCSCGGAAASTPAEKLAGTWMFTDPSGTSGTGVTFDAGGMYSFSALQLLSANTANVQAEVGVFDATDTQITTTPQKWTCPGPDPVVTVSYILSGSSLSVQSSGAIVIFTRDTQPATTNARFTLGCFQPDGTFVPAPLAPVSNQ
jgi:hypothetical protein